MRKGIYFRFIALQLISISSRMINVSPQLYYDIADWPCPRRTLVAGRRPPIASEISDWRDPCARHVVVNNMSLSSSSASITSYYQAPKHIRPWHSASKNTHGQYTEEMDREELWGAKASLGLVIEYTHSSQTLENRTS